MEILMKLKCASTPAHKVVDQQQQQQQQQSQLQQQQQQQQVHTQTHASQLLSGTCLPPTLECCSAAAVVNLQWERGGGPRCCGAAGYCTLPLPACCGVTYTPPATTPMPPNFNEETAPSDHYEYQEPEENFVSIDDAKIKGFLMKIGEEQRAQQQEQEKQRCQRAAAEASENTLPVVYEIIDLDDEEEREKLKRIKNQAENEAFVKKQQKQQASRSEESLPAKSATRQSPDISLVPKATEVSLASTQRRAKCAKLSSANAPLRIIAQIELLDSSSSDESQSEEEEEEIKQKTTTQKVEVDDEEEEEQEQDANDEDEDLPLAAAAVSCELEYDDNDDDDNEEEEEEEEHTRMASLADDEIEFDVTERAKVKSHSRKTKRKSNSVGKTKNNNNDNKNDDDDGDNDEIVVLASDDENIEFIEEHEQGLEVRWEELELEQRSGRNNSFECFVCGKKVQSNYNLRRHMMIHTGERPYGCDLCERRFREFSDLKKHRRRHTNEPNFVCMVCRVNTPTDCDPTRCSSCDSKNVALAALRPQVTPPSGSSESSPEKTATPPALPLLHKSPVLTANKINITEVFSMKSSSPKPTPTPPPPPPPPPPPQLQQKSVSPKLQPLPTLTPIKTHIDATQLHMLDTIPAVHRSTYSKDLGLVTRKEFPCPLCQRPFGTRHNLKRHFMIHTGEKPFNCSRCRKPFREYSTLKKHMITHARERWYKCLRCPQKFLDYLQYMTHKNSHPEETGGGSGSGAEDASASSSASAQSSPKKRTRQGLSSYRQDDSFDSQDEDSSTTDHWLDCCSCGQRFTELKAYTEHMKLHDAQLPYECYVCKQYYAELPELEQHMNEKHDTLLDSEDEDNYDEGDGDGDGDSDDGVDDKEFIAIQQSVANEVIVVQVGSKRKARITSG